MVAILATCGGIYFSSTHMCIEIFWKDIVFLSVKFRLVFEPPKYYIFLIPDSKLGEFEKWFIDLFVMLIQ